MWDEDPGQEQGLAGTVFELRDRTGRILAKKFGSVGLGRDGYEVKTNLMQKITSVHSCSSLILSNSPMREDLF